MLLEIRVKFATAAGKIIEVGFHTLILFTTFRGNKGTIKDHFPFVHVPKALQNDALANTDKENSEFIPDLVEPIKSGPSTFKIVSTPL